MKRHAPERSLGSKLRGALRSRSAPRITFLAAFAVVFFSLVGLMTLVAFVLPKIYSSSARVHIEPEKPDPAAENHNPDRSSPSLKSEFDLVQSEAILGKVCAQLNLADTWGRELHRNLSQSESIQMLRDRIQVHSYDRASFVIVASSESPDEAAQVANAIAEVYRHHYLEQSLVHGAAETAELKGNAASTNSARLAEIVHAAVPNPIAVRPRVKTYLAMGMLSGIFLGLVIGAASAGVVHLIGRRLRRQRG